MSIFAELTEAMEAAAKLPERSKCRQVTIRSGVVLGKYGGMIQRMWLPFTLGLGGPIGSGSQLLPWIHVKDLAELFLFAMTNKSVTGVLNGVAPEVMHGYCRINKIRNNFFYNYLKKHKLISDNNKQAVCPGFCEISKQACYFSSSWFCGKINFWWRTCKGKI